MLGPFATASRRTPPVLILHYHSPGVATVARRLRYSYSWLRLGVFTGWENGEMAIVN